MGRFFNAAVSSLGFISTSLSVPSRAGVADRGSGDGDRSIAEFDGGGEVGGLVPDDVHVASEHAETDDTVVVADVVVAEDEVGRRRVEADVLGSGSSPSGTPPDRRDLDPICAGRPGVATRVENNFGQNQVPRRLAMGASKGPRSQCLSR